MTLLTEFDEEASIRGWRNDGIIEGRLEAARSFYANGASIELIAKSLKMSEDQVREIVKEPVSVKA